MRILSTLFLSVAAFGAEYTIDPAHSSVGFTVRHMMVTNVRGQFSNLTGKISYDSKNIPASKVSASVDANTINTQQAKRDAHLRSADFFETDKYPKLSFESTKWYSEGGKTKIAGNLSMHGVTKPVVFQLEGPVAETKSKDGSTRAGVTATARIKRSEWGLTWNRALEAGGVTVSDEVDITLDIAAVSKP